MLRVTGRGLLVERHLQASNSKTLCEELPKPSRENAGAAAVPETQAWGRLEKKRPGLTTSSSLYTLLGKEKGKVNIPNPLSVHVERKPGLAVSSGNGD